MIQRIVLIGLFLSAALCVAKAGEAPDDSEKCVGPMCLFTPIYRIGKTMMPAEPAPSAARTDPPASPVNAPQHSGSTVEAPHPDQPPGDDQSSASDNGSAATEQNNKAITPAAPLPAESNPRTHRRPTLQAKRHDTRTLKHLAQGSGVGTLSAGAGAVTVSAAEPEMGRLLALASVVKKPSISVIPDNGFGPGCSADFVVDTLLSPRRLGPAIPLFSESLIIVARKDVSNLRELRGRQVSFGPSSGSSERVAQRLFRSLDIRVKELPLDVDNALDGLALGELDAVALLVPRGYDRLSRHDPQLHLLGLGSSTAPPEGLRVSRIDPASYLGGTWSDQSLSVVTVDAVLSPNQEATRHASAMSLYAALDRGASRLAQNGFDLIGDESPVMTMRSVAKDADTSLAPPIRVDRSLALKGCGQ